MASTLPGKQIIERHHGVTVGQQAVGEM